MFQHPTYAPTTLFHHKKHCLTEGFQVRVRYLITKIDPDNIYYVNPVIEY